MTNFRQLIEAAGARLIEAINEGNYTVEGENYIIVDDVRVYCNGSYAKYGLTATPYVNLKELSKETSLALMKKQDEVTKESINKKIDELKQSIKNLEAQKEKL